MTLTNFPDGVSSFGVPLIGGLGGIPLTGTWYFLDPATGSDGNDGLSPESPLSTLAFAYTKTKDGNNDVIVLIGDGTTAATARLSAQLVWAKNATHLIGVTAPSMVAQRARISTAVGATTNIANLVNVTGQGCIFANFSLFQGVGQAATAEQLWQDAGERNYYYNVSFGGMGSANGAAQAGSYSLKLYGAGENLFDSCYFGADTQNRDAANSNVLIRKDADNVASTRNIFRNCVFAMRATDTDPLFIDSNESGSMDRFTLFQNCTFINSGTSTLTVGISFNASQGGTIVLDKSTIVGATNWSANTTVVQNSSGPANIADGGIAVAIS